jgi:hypothetical protein
MLALGVPNPLGPVVGFGANQVLQAIGQWVASGASWLLAQVGSVMTSTTKPELDGAWFSSHYRVMAGLAAAVVLPLLLLSVLQAVVRQDMGTLLRTALVHLPLSLLLTAVAVTVVQLGLGAVDVASDTVAKSAGLDTRNLLSTVSSALSGPTGDPSLPLFVTFLAGLLVALGAFALWLELVMRSAAIYAAVLFLPIAMAGLVWPATSRWARRLAELLAALVVSKLAVVGVMSLAAGALSGGAQAADLAGVIGGAALLWVAAFSPFALLRLVPVVEAGAIDHLEGMARRAPRAVVHSVDMLATALAGVGSGAAEGPGGAAGVGMATGVPASDDPPDRGHGPRGGGGPAGSDGSGGWGGSGGSDGGDPTRPGRPPAGPTIQRGGPGAVERSGDDPGTRQAAQAGEGVPDEDRELGSRLLDAWVRTAGDE